MSLRRSNRKQQTQLTFSPLPSSSAAASGYSDQIQRRAAAVRYDQSPSPSKKRRVNNPPPRQTVLTATRSHGLNTPIKSSQSVPGTRLSDSKEDFRIDSSRDEVSLPTPLALSQTEKGDEQPAKASLLTSTRLSGANALAPRTAGNTRIKGVTERGNQYLSEEDELALPRVRKRGTGSTPVTLSSDDDSDSVPVEPITPRRKRPSSSAVRSPLQFLVGGRSGAAPLSNSQRRKSVDSGKQRSIPTKAPRAASPPQRFMRSSARARPNRNLAQASTDDETEFESSPNIQTKLTRKSQPSHPHSTPSHKADTTDDDEDIVPSAGRSGRQKSKAATVISSDNQSSDEYLGTSSNRRRFAKKVVELSSPESQDSAYDLQEDLDALQETAVLETRTRTRKNTAQRSKRQEQLELLKRRRAGGTRAVQDLESGAAPTGEALQGQSTDEEVSEETADSATEHIRQTLSGGQNLNEYADDDDGFLDDEEDTIGAPLGLEDMPLEFTRHAHKKPIQHFKDIVEWMIHNKVNPAFARHDPIYQIAVRKLDDEVQGYSASKFLSSAWNAEFLKALKARPELFRLEVGAMFDHKCDACNRSGHPATNQLTFSGNPYNRDTLENVNDDEDEDDDGDDDNDDEGGNSSSHEEQNFYLGR